MLSTREPTSRKAASSCGSDDIRDWSFRIVLRRVTIARLDSHIYARRSYWVLWVVAPDSPKRPPVWTAATGVAFETGSVAWTMREEMSTEGSERPAFLEEEKDRRLLTNDRKIEHFAGSGLGRPLKHRVGAARSGRSWVRDARRGRMVHSCPPEAPGAVGASLSATLGAHDVGSWKVE